ncbi:shikimate dehydrogenase [Porphyrobacter sp. GA68]|uniref:shikimate dehydrogenase family protein n=1 Tax=Porphyrobacter sp. GA68 TaxID=2883480 RepID=UPI001D195316|nr:shikimate dehydrogenase [Porphyrobacter sp. GA68]
MTPYAEVIGSPVAQSKSPAIHRFWLQKLEIEADYRATEVPGDGLPEYLERRRDDPHWRGCNVTMPLKQMVLPLLDHVATDASAIGAVNTVVRAGSGALSGHNTDAGGFVEPLAPLLAERHWLRMARVIGTGGAARAIVHALAEHGFVIVLAGRDRAKARSLLMQLAPEGEHHTPPLEHFASATDFAFDDREGCLDLVINASALGMQGQPPLAFDWSHAPPGAIAYDIITDPVQTTFLRRAEAAGHRTIDGLAMLIGQAAAAFELFFGRPAPRQHDAELRALLTR